MKKYLGPLIAALVVLFVSASPMRASEWNHLTKLIVHQTIQVPGAVLTPGTYWVRLVDSQSDRYIVQFMNADQDKALSTTIAIPDERMHVTGHTRLVFYEAAPGTPPALRAWWYPGAVYGDEFVYPKNEAMNVAHTANRNVPAMDQTDMNRLSNNSSTADSALSAGQNSRVYSVTPQSGTMNYNTAETQNEKMDNNSPSQTNNYQSYGEVQPGSNNSH
ncbi:MAG TPA: hypothetical protein VHZ07_05640 [Bryobacteraceae bacterium]|nr:hypothetical protein [Bryobacteraceae bacterium]